MTLLFFGSLAMPGMHWEFCWIALDYKRWKLLWRQRISGTSFPTSYLTNMGSILWPGKNRGSGSASHHLHLSSVKPHGNTINIHPNFQILPPDLNCHLISTSSQFGGAYTLGEFSLSLPTYLMIQIPNCPPSTEQISLSDTDKRWVCFFLPLLFADSYSGGHGCAHIWRSVQ